MRTFPHLSDSDFPNAGNIDVYKYANEFDYTRYDDIQMRLQLCNVPWDMGEAHIGNRTISGIGNVVYFSDKAARDAWFAAIPDNECYRFETKFKELHRDNLIDVPIPFDVASKYNYLCVHYALFANDRSLVEYETSDGLRDWYWFVREVEFLAPNTTRLHLMADAWQTYIYDLDVSGMILERGHAPMMEVTASEYLDNPIANADTLLAEDVVNEQSAEIGYAASELIFNAGTMLAVIISTANPVNGTWGTKAADTWKTDGSRHFTQSGVPSYCAFAMAASDLNGFLANADRDVPQFLQTIQGVCFINQAMVTLSTAFTFAGVSCNLISSGYTATDVLDIDASMFGYPTTYRDIAKLYTYPYAYIQLSDDKGNTTDIRIETTDGTIKFASCINLVYPWLEIDGHLLSQGRGSSRNISFKAVTTRTMPIKGNWYDSLQTWEIPVFAITQDAGIHNDYATHYDREQMDYSATNARTSANASADTDKAIAYRNALTTKDNAVDNASTSQDIAYREALTTKDNAVDTASTEQDISYRSASAAKSNAIDSASISQGNSNRDAATGKSNSDASANTAVAISALQQAANTANTLANTVKIDSDSIVDQAANTVNTAQSNQYIDGTTNNQISADNQRAAIAASAAGAKAAAGAIVSALTGNIAGAIGQAVGGGAEAASIMASNEVTVNQTATQAGLQKSRNDQQKTVANNTTGYKADYAKTNAETVRDNTNALTMGSTNASAATMKKNATRTRDNIIDNATDSYAEIAGGNTTAGVSMTGTANRSETAAKANADDSYHNVAGGSGKTGTAIRTKAASEANADDSYHNVAGGSGKTGTAVRTKAAAESNADARNTTDKANATRAYNVAENAIDMQVAQAAMDAPSVFGIPNAGDTATTRPMGLFADIITQDPYSIAYAGDEMLRYGYRFNRQWDFDGDWNIPGCKYFTYWKLTDFWVKNLSIPDMYVDRIRFFLFGGVTVWRSPEAIGRKSIYENIDWS